jgi:Na+/phosphate symporter
LEIPPSAKIARKAEKGYDEDMPAFGVRLKTDYTEERTHFMKEKAYVELIGHILEILGNTIDEVKRCLFSRDKRRLTHAEKAFALELKSSLPLCETLIAKKEKPEGDQEFIALLPSLQRIGIAGEDLLQGVRATLEAEISLTDKAFGEISEVMGLVKDLARDTNDALATGNARFREYARAEANHAVDRVEEYGLNHEQRLAVGACSPRASFVYLDIMRSLKRIATELSSFAEKA